MGSLEMAKSTVQAQKSSSTLFQRDELLQVRTGKAKMQFGLELSGIYKSPSLSPVFVSTLGCTDDERSYPPHKVAENALHHYASQHYAIWAAEHPSRAHHFQPGAFGENLVSSNASEDTVCIGDIMSIGNRGLLVQVTKPRQPCYKLNHRFEIKDMSLRSQTSGRTGWYYRILQNGWIQAGDSMVLVERKHPKWTISEVQRLLYKDRNHEEDMRELSVIPELGEEIRSILEARLAKQKTRDDSARLQGGESNLLKWFPYKVIAKRRETPRICSFILEAADQAEEPITIQPGSHVGVKLGDDGKLVRAYSVVSGDSNRFKLAIALEPESRGGSMFMHEKIKAGDSLSFSEIKSDFPLQDEAEGHIMIAGGIGITAFVAAAKHLRERSVPFQLHYAVRSTGDIALSEDLLRLGPNLSIWDSSKGQRLDLEKVLGHSNKYNHVYVCGPERLLSAVTGAAKIVGFPGENIQVQKSCRGEGGTDFTGCLERCWI
jgi:MOSC domain-containing protein YiiM/ferredoxin-NADP reductase